MAVKYNLKSFLLKQGKKIGGRWTLDKKLGGGGNGEVWQCRDSDNSRFAIKFLKWGSGLGYKRFYDEVTFMKSYQGVVSGILPIIDSRIPRPSKNMDYSSPFYYVMPLCESASTSILKMDIDGKIRAMISLLEMMVELHRVGVAHRDIKPANILLYNNSYVLSDFGLVFFYKKTAKTPPNGKLGARWTISPQMERDSNTADKYKADVYSMAKTIWMLFTGEMTSFEGQFAPYPPTDLSHALPSLYLTPLNNLLSRCTDNNEENRPSADEMLNGFKEWIEINHNWPQENLFQWMEVNRRIFPFSEPDFAQWRDLERMINILTLLGTYNSLNHLFFPDHGGGDLQGAKMAKEPGCIELICDGLVYILKPKHLSFVRISDDFQWNFYWLELDDLVSVEGEGVDGQLMEECIEITPFEYLTWNEHEKLSDEELREHQARHVARYLKGSIVIFKKDSIYNHMISRYEGEHYLMGIDRFKSFIHGFVDSV